MLPVSEPVKLRYARWKEGLKIKARKPAKYKAKSEADLSEQCSPSGLHIFASLTVDISK
jgi:hypothetical protein